MFISFCASSIFMFFLYALDYEEFYLQKEFPCECGKLWKGKEFVNLCLFFLSLVTSSLTGSKALYCFPEFHYKASAETECFGLGLGSSPFSIFFSQLKFFSETPLSANALQTKSPTTNNNNRHFYTLSSFCHFCLQYFMCNTQKQHDNNLRLVSSIPVFTPSDVLHGVVWAFWSFRILITFIENEISGKEFDCDIFGLAV